MALLALPATGVWEPILEPPLPPNTDCMEDHMVRSSVSGIQKGFKALLRWTFCVEVKLSIKNPLPTLD